MNFNWANLASVEVFLQLHFNLSFTVSNLDVLEKQEAFKFGKQAKQKLLTRNRNFRHNTKQGQNFKICSYYKAVLVLFRRIVAVQ